MYLNIESLLYYHYSATAVEEYVLKAIVGAYETQCEIDFAF